MVSNGKRASVANDRWNLQFLLLISSVPANEALKIRPGFFNFMRNFMGIDSAPIFYTDFKFRSVCIQDVGYLIAFRYEDKKIFWRIEWMAACRFRSRRLSQSMGLASIGMFSRLSAEFHLLFKSTFNTALATLNKNRVWVSTLWLMADLTTHE